MKFDSSLGRGLPDGALLLMGISYEGQILHKVFTYALLKAGGQWWVTGGGRVPMAAGWPAVERWLERDGRVVEWVRVATAWDDLYPTPSDLSMHAGLQIPCDVCNGPCRIDV